MASNDNVATSVRSADVRSADLVIGAVLVPGVTAPKLVDRSILRQMQQGAVLVDISIDQGGCFESSRPTTHDIPTYVEEGVVHYCVTNMPGGVARTSTEALNNVTLPYVRALASKGWRQAMADDPGFAKGLNVSAGRLPTAPSPKRWAYLGRHKRGADPEICPQNEAFFDERGHKADHRTKPPPRMCLVVLFVILNIFGNELLFF